MMKGVAVVLVVFISCNLKVNFFYSMEGETPFNFISDREHFIRLKVYVHCIAAR